MSDKRHSSDLAPSLVIEVPREKGIEIHAYNDIHYEVSAFLDRIRRNEGLVTSVERNDNDTSMTLKVGMTEHEARGAIVRGIVDKFSHVCSRYGLSSRKSKEGDTMMVRSVFTKKASSSKKIAAEQGLNRRIWAALEEMGVIHRGMVAGDIRWQAVFFIGPSGSGKSWIRNVRYTRHLDFKVIDPDDVKRLHPDYNPEKPFELHAWSKQVSDAEFDKIITSGNGDPVIVDGTGRNVEGVLGKMAEASRNGYRTYIVYVYVPFEISVFRNRNRSRFVPEDIVIEQSSKITKNFAILKSHADKSKVIPNYTSAELREAERDIQMYPVPQAMRPPRPGDSNYGLAKAASALFDIARLVLR